MKKGFIHFDKKLFVYLIVTLFVLIGCRKLEADLDSETIVLETPIDGFISTDQDIDFRWEDNPYVLNYEFQLVTPSFSTPVSYVIDSITEGTLILATLSPGHYQWRVRGMNNSDSTSYTVNSFVIDSTENLCNNSVQISAPIEGSRTNDSVIVFTWEEMIAADYYKLYVNTGTAYVQVGDEISTTFYEYEIPSINKGSDYAIRWKVEGYNEISFTCTPTINNFTIDLSNPTAPNLTSPINSNSVDSSLVTFKWSVASDVEQSKIYLYGSDSTQLMSTFPKTVNAQEYAFNINSSDSVFHWRVIAVDSAGNESPFSDFGKFLKN